MKYAKHKSRNFGKSPNTKKPQGMLWDCRSCQIDLTMRLFQKLALHLIFRNLSDSHEIA